MILNISEFEGFKPSQHRETVGKKMRKGQIKLVENVKKIYGEQNNIVAFFENSEMPLNRLNSIYRILKCINKEELFCLNADELQEIIVKIDNHAEKLYFALMYHIRYNDSVIHHVSFQEFEEICNYIESPEYCKETLDVYEYCETFAQAKAVIAKCPIGFDLDDFVHSFERVIIAKRFHANIDEVMPYVMESLSLSEEQRDRLYAFSAWGWSLDLIRKYHYDIQSYKKTIAGIMLSGCDMQNFDKELWEQYDYYQDYFPISLEEKEKLQSLNLQSNIEIYRETFYKNVSFSKNAITIHLMKYDSFKWNDNSRLNYGKKDRSDKIVYFYNTGKFYKEIKEKSILISINLREIMKLISVYGSMITDFLYPYFEMLAEDNKIYLDVLRIMKNTKNDNKYHTCIPPIPLSEFKGKHTLKEVMTSYYKNTEDIPWNKVDIKICYAYFKLRKKIEPAGYTILWDWLNDHSKSLTILDTVFFEILMSRFTENSYWENIDIYGKKQKVTEKTVRYTVQDYIRFCYRLHKKIRLTFTSAKKMKELHDDYAVIIKNKYTPTIKIPKNTKFKELEKLLPTDEFTWIKTKRKIIREGVEMHHCVATYADLVNKDICAIYGFIRKDNHRRYTIEFRKNKNGYYIEQMQSMCDRGYIEEDYAYVQSLLNKNKKYKTA